VMVPQVLLIQETAAAQVMVDILVLAVDQG
jgi:hypothetical protein